MSEPTEPPQPEPSTFALVAKGIALIFAAFVSATVILQLHYPLGH